MNGSRGIIHTHRPDQEGYVTRLFCVRCGTRLRRVRERDRRVPGCPRCGWIDWFNPAPTVSVLIQRGGRVLLVRRAFVPARGAWDVPGGFIDRGETAERAARREMREELGVDVRIGRFLGTFSDTYGPDRLPSLNLYYLGRLARDGATVRASDDASECRWFPLDRTPRRMAFKNNRDAVLALRRLLREGRARRRGTPAGGSRSTPRAGASRKRPRRAAG
jgi:ADP-ribose pyrophosphatase YjhB (NUDIX family)